MTIAEKLTKVAENVPKVYTAGQQSEYDRFWDAYQANGTRTSYIHCFAGNAWNEETFKPKYDIKPKWGGAANMFQNFGFVGSLKEHLSNLGVKIDLSGLSGCSQLFYQATGVTELPELDFSNCTATLTNLFYGCTSLKTMTLKIDETIAFANTCFTNCTALEEIRFEGVIGNSLDIHWSKKLSMMSLASIVGALSDTVTGQTITLPTTAESTYDSATISGRWKELVASKPNWTFAYA